MAQLSAWQDYASHKLYLQQILIPLTVRNNIHVLPVKTGIVLSWPENQGILFFIIFLKHWK